jgi:hypothetical protein
MGRTPRRWISLEREPKDSFCLNLIRRASNIVKRPYAERSDISIPFGQVRKHNDWGAPGSGGQNAHCRAKVAVRQIVTAKHELKRLILGTRARLGQRFATNRLQAEAARDFRRLFALKRIGRYDQHVAGVDHIPPPSTGLSSGQKESVSPV